MKEFTNNIPEAKKIDGTIVGYDPGGNDQHGLTILQIQNGQPVDIITVQTLANSESVICAILEMEHLIGLGVDTLSCWGTGVSGWRPADKWLRRQYPEVQNSVMSPNSLSGSMGINGMSVLIEVARKSNDIVISETHPKVLYYGLTHHIHDYQNDGEEMNSFLSEELGINVTTANEHEWDAVISAYALLMGVTGKWKLDLHALPTEQNERIVKPCGKTYYYWPVEAL